MTTLISFLGAGNYSDTTYIFGAQRHLTCYMTDAAVRFFTPSRLLVYICGAGTTPACSVA